MKVPLNGGAPTTLASGINYPFVAATGYPPAIVVDDTNAYWTIMGTFADPNFTPDGSVMKVSLDGGDPTALASRQTGPNAIAVDGTNVYWTTGGRGAAGAVMKVSRDGGTPTALAPPDGEVGVGIAVDPTNVYWTHQGTVNHYGAGMVMRVPTAGGTPTMMVLELSPPWAVAVDKTSIYWMDLDATMVKMPLDGGTETTFASFVSSGVGAFAAPSNIALDDVSVYWVDEGTSSIMKAPKDGGSPTTVVSMKPPAWAVP